jgi:hypothetical protein
LQQIVNLVEYVIRFGWHPWRQGSARSQTLEKQWAAWISDRYDLWPSGIKLTGVKIDRVNRQLSRLNQCNPRVLTTVCK